MKKWFAAAASGTHRRITPQGACVHSKARVGCGSVMNILGIGLDATDIPRLADVLERYGDRFMHRVFTAGEIAYCTKRRNPAPHFAGRFAAKEAAMKALGTGHSQGVLWKDIEVIRVAGRRGCSCTAGRPSAPRACWSADRF